MAIPGNGRRAFPSFNWLRKRPRVPRWLSGLRIQYCPCCGSADFEVSGPDTPVQVQVGEDAELWCHLSLNISVEDMELRWYRDRLSPAVYVHRNGSDVQEEQMESYRGRTTFVNDSVAQGRAAVRIHNVGALDNGTFHCRFTDKDFNEATLWLRVAGKFQPVRPLVSPRASSLKFGPGCSSSAC
uniref:Ig-like domain-containing protein n=1 Tax=Catagonus wagneri TaxID=51154 RepID=A0A8C3YSC8_9CETA